ncbi:helix-turn-helix domain-containing protein [Cedecea davisae]|uniref:Helix-turn-helix domain-containing protein n=1 Tax=Cedecea davisae TaxID=158484 RepID=A0ABS6DMN9_9ENTR|nr:helix-turn-helix transcriptional regulator [Cedecea davisae]MBU4684472.1 helix-turn-helix domain-containing protein [Cedecea davisae]MBU4688682.1 helix-turn-helix domain-containing protein [Cedecea davisae]
MTLPHEPTFLPFQKDWHQADIIAALRKKGTSLAAVSREAGLSSSTLANALSRPWAKGEMLISKAIGVPASTIWPSRYFDPQTHQMIERPMRSSGKE